MEQGRVVFAYIRLSASTAHLPISAENINNESQCTTLVETLETREEHTQNIQGQKQGAGLEILSYHSDYICHE
eukprot:1141260-Pelagomonas_calceolata.AAC.2